jgi:hypothetical protein
VEACESGHLNWPPVRRSFFTDAGPGWVVTTARWWGGVSSPILAPPWVRILR